MYKEVVEVPSNYKKSYFWWSGNSACGDSTESNWIEKHKVVYLLDLFEGKREKGQCDLVCWASLDDWANASFYIDVAFMLMSYSCVVGVVSIFGEIGPFLRNECII